MMAPACFFYSHVPAIVEQHILLSTLHGYASTHTDANITQYISGTIHQAGCRIFNRIFKLLRGGKKSLDVANTHLKHNTKVNSKA
jgi:hypothetical protein